MKQVKEYSGGDRNRGKLIVAHLKRWGVDRATGTEVECRMKLEERRSDLLKRVNGLQKLYSANPTDKNKEALDKGTRELRLISGHMKAKYETR